jgi:hypothetical protein
MGFKGQRDFRHVGWYLRCKQAKSFVNVIQHGDGDVTCIPPIRSLIFNPRAGGTKVSMKSLCVLCRNQIFSPFFFAWVSRCSLRPLIGYLNHWNYETEGICKHKSKHKIFRSRGVCQCYFKKVADLCNNLSTSWESPDITFLEQFCTKWAV